MWLVQYISIISYKPGWKKSLQAYKPMGLDFMKQIGSKLEIVQLALHAAADRIAMINALEAAHANAQPEANEEQIRQEKVSLKNDIINIINGLSLIEKSIK